MTILESRKHLAAEMPEFVLGWQKSLPKVTPWIGNDPFGIEPFLAARSDIATRTRLQDIVDSCDFLARERSCADERVGSSHRAPVIAREGPLIERTGRWVLCVPRFGSIRQKSRVRGKIVCEAFKAIAGSCG